MRRVSRSETNRGEGREPGVRAGGCRQRPQIQGFSDGLRSGEPDLRDTQGFR